MMSQLTNKSESVRKATSLRCRGENSDALRLLQQLSNEYPGDVELKIEIALCYSLQHRFDTIAEDMAGSDSDGNIEHNDRAIYTLIVHYGRVHTDLRLQEAVAMCEAIAERWLRDLRLGSPGFGSQELYLICLYAFIQDMRERCSIKSTVDPSKLPPASIKDDLHQDLLCRDDFEGLLLFHSLVRPPALQATDAAERAIQLQQVLDQLRNVSPVLSMEKQQLEARFSHLLAECLRNCGKHDQSLQLLTAQRAFTRTGNEVDIAWIQLELILSGQEYLQTDQIRRLLELFRRFTATDEWRGAHECLWAIAKIYRRNEKFIQYGCLLASRLHIPDVEVTSSTAELSNEDTEMSRTIRSAYDNQGQGSSLEFWLAYVVDFLAEDECDHRRSGITIRICTQFFEDNKQCSIPQLQYTLAATISGLYEVIGDPREAMQWAYRSFIYAKEGEDNDSIADAECLLQGLLANRTRVEKGDTEEYQQQRFEEDKKTTLEILYHEAESSGHLKEQFSYAQNLMHFQYKIELKSNNNPTGEPWLSRARQVLQRMSADNISSQQELLLDFTLAHAKFDFGDFKGAIEGFDSIIGGCIIVQEPLKAHTLFSRGRAYLEEYRATNDTNLWKLSESSLLEASEISGRLGNMDEVACCESVLAYLWYARSREDTGAMITALEHVTKADKLWSKEMKNNGGLPGLPGLMSRYLIQSRSRLEPYDIPGLAFKICFRISAFEEAWVWAERLKARTFGNSLRSAGITTNVNQTDIPTHPCPDEMQINDVDRNSIFVHWVISGDIVYLLTRRHGQNAFMFLLDIKLSTVSDWYSSLCDSKDDLSDPDDAEETLAELVELCRPLSLSEISSPGELLVLCPTRILFKIPLHALPVDGVPLIERNPVVYAYASPLLQRQSYTADITNPEKQVNSFGNPTGNTPGGESAAKLIQQTLGGEGFTNAAARKETYMNLCTESRVLHYHGHILVASHELSNAMIFHDEELTAREVFGMDLKNYSPLVCLIGCGSGVERIDVGDEPLGFISGYLYAGASAVIATLWPINDILSGEAFSRAFYSSFLRESRNSGGQVNLAGLLQEAVREIRVKPETRAPYFWAPFVLHGAWNFCLCT